jgi:hypothetical protein
MFSIDLVLRCDESPSKSPVRAECASTNGEQRKEGKQTAESSTATTSLKIKSFSDLKAASQASAGQREDGSAAHWTQVEGQPVEEQGKLLEKNFPLLQYTDIYLY